MVAAIIPQGEDVFTTTPRQAFRTAGDQVAANAKAVLPESASRIDKAVQIVLQGDVELLPDGHARVASQCQGTLVYRIVNGTCECRDYAQAPSGWCKHRIAAGIQRRAGQVMPQAPQPTPPALPEAPVSVNCHVTIAGRQVQVTLRDTDETRLLTRLTALLAQYPIETPATPSAPAPEDWCQVHQVQMRRNEKDGRSWWSHKSDDGSWCKGKEKGQGR
jgi:hypothetical protein